MCHRPLEKTWFEIYGCPLVYKSGWIRAVSAGFEPTINTRGALGGLAERPAVLDAPR